MCSMISISEFEHSTMHWWLHHTPIVDQAFVIMPRSVSSMHVQGKTEWDNCVLEGGNWDGVLAVLEPLIAKLDGERPQDRAVRMLHSNGFLVGFDVWWRGKKGPSKGYLPVPSPLFFFSHILKHVAPPYRTFYQGILPHRSCAFYFDVDGEDPDFDMVYFLQALFEEIAKLKRDVTVEQLWAHTILLDASRNAAMDAPTKSSCHGICHSPELVFPDNHTTMKAFAHRLKACLEQRPDHQKLLTFKKKKNAWVSPLDLSVYSFYRNFRLYLCVKMTADVTDRRPLVVAPYNRFANMPPKDDQEALFLLTVIPQGPDQSAPPVVRQEHKVVRSVDERRRKSTNNPLVDYLLTQVWQWGNHQATVSRVEDARDWPEGSTYVAFAQANHAHDHVHRSNNIFAIVEVRALRIHWFCQKGSSSSSCRVFKQLLPIELVMQ